MKRDLFLEEERIMKNKTKLGILALAALVVFSMIILACNNVVSPNEKPSEGITLNVGTPRGARALIGTGAQAGSDFYEATFVNMGTNVITRTVWNWNTTGNIQLPPGTYKMLLMAGRYEDKTLLGVGRVTKVVDLDSANEKMINPDIDATTPIDDNDPINALFTIEPTTTALEISVEPLMTDISEAGTAFTIPKDWLEGNATFKITSETVADTGDDLIQVYYDKVSQNGDDIPLFHLKQADVTATWDFAVQSITGDTRVDNGYNTDIFVTGEGIIKQSGLTPMPGELTAATTVCNTTFALDTPAAIGPDPFALTLGVPVTGSGLVKISVEVPVVAYAPTDNPQTWYIRGGINSELLDPGAITTPSELSALGGAIAIGYGNIAEIDIEFDPN
jgi:hypothetical protein